MYEDTSENVYSAHCIISECGQILGENKPFSNDGECTAVIDLKKISYLRSVNTTFENKYDNVRYISFEQEIKNTEFSSGRFYKNPFTKDSRQIGEDKFCEIVNISAAALASRICAKAPQRLIYKAQDSANDIFTVYCAIKALEISKMEQCTLCVLKNNSRNEIHSLFKKLGATVCDTADTENSLFLKGNDLLDYALYSVERAEGETYALNASLSKCTVLCCVAHIRDLLENKVFEGLINDLYKESYTPRTDLLEFILFYSFRFGFSPAKILRLALKAFEGDFNKDQIQETMADFYKRFFDNQSVRWNMPEGAKAASLSLLSKTDFRIPSCVCIDDWIREIEELKSN
jgi:NAD+ synthase (glutamine-hydrolysing)